MENPNPMTREEIIRKIERLMKIRIDDLDTRRPPRIKTLRLEQVLKCKDNAARRILLGISR